MALKIIKTLSHLNKLYLNNETTIYSNYYSVDVLNTINSAEIILKGEINFTDLMQNLANPHEGYLNDSRPGELLKFERVENPGEQLEFSIKGDIFSIWLIGYDFPIRIEFFGDEVEEIYFYDYQTGKKLRDLRFIIFARPLLTSRADLEEIFVHKFIEPAEKKQNLKKIIFTNRPIDGINKFFDEIDLDLIDSRTEFPQLFFSNLQLLSKEIDRLEKLGFNILISTNNIKKIPADLKRFIASVNEGKTSASRLQKSDSKNNKEISNRPHKISMESLKNLPAGFIDNKNRIAVFTDREIFGSISLKTNQKGKIKDRNFQKLLKEFEGEIELDSYVVHEDYGVAQYKGLQQEKATGTINEYLLLEFANNDELYVPINQLNKISKYLGQEGISPKLTDLGRGNWKKVKEKIKKSTELVAKELLEHQAKRSISKAEKVSDKDSPEYKKFVKDFPYSETDDQLTSINEVISDLEQEEPMDRLLVGDVGFGKTEVIMRAAFKIVENGGQVAILSPTTVLTVQHLNTFKERFKNFNYKINAVSRFNSGKENREIIDKSNLGEIDILIGTHRLLSTDVKFKNLQLLVVDEEQKFGVKQKEKIKKLNYGLHVLSVSATPIPRTLSLALSSLQDISVITTPPSGRQPVATEIIFNDWKKVANAVQNEISRGGQVYLVHNRVQTIGGIENKLLNLIPNITFKVAHGQMSSDKLDKVITEFYEKKFDVLISTSIIENGLDLPNVNTIIIHDSHKFGLSQLYQMRGRVGRSDRNAYCYLMAPQSMDSSTALHQPVGTNHGLSLQENLGLQSELETNDALRKKIKAKNKARKLYLERLETLVNNQDLGAGFKVASKDLELRGAGNILGENQSGHISQIGYALYIEMLAEQVEKQRGS